MRGRVGRSSQQKKPTGSFVKPVFNPYGLNPTAVYDFSDTSTITDSSNDITGINDKSGNANHITSVQGTPTTNTRTKNGLNVADLDGSSDSFDFPSSLHSLPNGANTAVIVWGSDTTADQGASGYRPLRGRVPTNSTRWGQLVNRNATNLFETVNNSAFTPVNHNPDPAWDTNTHCTGLRFDGSTGLDVLFDGNVASGAGTTVSGIFSMDAGLLVDGYICEIWLFNKELTNSELLDLGDWLAAKWNFTWRRKVNIVWHGDSRTDGVGGSGDKMHQRVEPLLNYAQLTQSEHATGGEKIQTTEAAYLGDIQADKDTDADINISVINGHGINDCRLDATDSASAATTAQAIIDAWTNMCSDAHDEGYVVHVSTIPWRTSNDTYQEQARNTANDWLRANHATIADAFFDLAAQPELGDDGTHDGDAGDSTYYVDVSHFGDAGQDIWADYLDDSIQALIDAA